MEEMRIVDTTLRDGDISLWAYGMTTGMMLPALRHLDRGGFRLHGVFLEPALQEIRSRAQGRSLGLAAVGHQGNQDTPGCVTTAGCTAVLSLFPNAFAGW